MPKTGYEIFVGHIEDLEEGKELEKQIRDAQTYETKYVIALFSPSQENLPDGEPLWIRSLQGALLDENPWRIKIVKEL